MLTAPVPLPPCLLWTQVMAMYEMLRKKMPGKKILVVSALCTRFSGPWGALPDVLTRPRLTRLCLPCFPRSDEAKDYFETPTTMSRFAVELGPDMPGCFTPLVRPVLFECRCQRFRDDLTPCTVPLRFHRAQ